LPAVLGVATVFNVEDINPREPVQVPEEVLQGLEAVRFLHKAICLSQPVMFHEFAGPVGDLRSRVPLVHRNSVLSSILPRLPARGI
jgi:hypothetical protein